MKLSIIILNYNTKDYLIKCLASLKETIKGIETEVIVVDNGSMDGSQTYINANKILKIQLIENNNNYGFAKGNNIGIKESLGDYVLLLNPDVVIPEQEKSIKDLLDYMDQNSKVGIVTCRVELTNGKLDDSCHRGFPTPWNAFCYFLGLSRIFSKNEKFSGYNLTTLDLNTIHEIDACNGAFMLIRRHCGEQLHWLDEDYFWYGEDLDFCYRAKQTEWKVIYWPKMKIIHYKGVASGIKGGKTTANREIKIKATEARFRVMKIFYDKHYKNKYPSWIRMVVLLGVELKKRMEMAKI